jgi:hypothetical protein
VPTNAAVGFNESRCSPAPVGFLFRGSDNHLQENWHFQNNAQKREKQMRLSLSAHEVEGGVPWRNGCDGRVLCCGAGERHQQKHWESRLSLLPKPLSSCESYRYGAVFVGRCSPNFESRFSLEFPLLKSLEAWSCCAPFAPIMLYNNRGRFSFTAL